MDPIHLRPTTELAERVLLPGDPGRALAVAQEVLDQPVMFNHSRGLWGYTGNAADGRPLTIQATGMGGPSAAIVIEELVALGARTMIRIGTCGAFDPDLALGDLVTTETVIGEDGTSAALAADEALHADRHLTAAMVAAGATGVTGVTTDLFYDPRADAIPRWRAAGAQVVEMEAATLLALAARHEIEAAVLLAVTDLIDADRRERIPHEALAEAATRLGEIATAAL